MSYPLPQINRQRGQGYHSKRTYQRGVNLILIRFNAFVSLAPKLFTFKTHVINLHFTSKTGEQMRTSPPDCASRVSYSKLAFRLIIRQPVFCVSNIRKPQHRGQYKGLEVISELHFHLDMILPEKSPSSWDFLTWYVLS